MSDPETVYGYEIYRSKEKDKDFKKYLDYTVSNHFVYQYFNVNSTKYYYKIRAYMIKDGEKVFSPFTKAVKPIYDELKRANDFADVHYSYMPASRNELYGNLRDEGFPDDLAEQVARNYNGEWVSIAKYLIKDYTSKEDAISYLTREWFTDVEIEEATKDF